MDIKDVIFCKEMYVESCVEYNKDLEELVRLIKLDYSLIECEVFKLYCEIV